MKTNEKRSSQSENQVKKVKSAAGFGTFIREKKVRVADKHLCSECSKTFNSAFNLKRHMVSELHKKSPKRKRAEQLSMRRVRKFLTESDNLKEINRQRKNSDTFGLIGATLIEDIMTQIPQISNRNMLKTLTEKEVAKGSFPIKSESSSPKKMSLSTFDLKGALAYLWNWTLGQAEEKQHFLIDSSLSRHVKINKVRIPCVIGSEHSQSLLLIEFCDILDSCASEQMKII